MKNKILNLFLISIISILFCSVVCGDEMAFSVDFDVGYDIFLFEGQPITLLVWQEVAGAQDVKISIYKSHSTMPYLEISFGVGETKEVDLDRDGFNDMSITFRGIDYQGWVDIKIVTLSSSFTGCDPERCNYLTDQPTCYDSDYGDDIYVKGTVIVNGDSYSDYCDDINHVWEYSCENNEVLKSSLYCPHGCENGACIKVAVTTTCTESDGGHNPLIKGTTTLNGDSASDMCANSDELVEFYCSSAMDTQEPVIAQDPHVSCSAEFGSNFICQNGACVEETYTPTCTDSDGGYDIYTKGTLIAAGAKNVDYCSSSNMVEEYKCESPNSGNIINEGFPCPSGYICSDGACVPSKVPSQPKYIPPQLVTTPPKTEGCDGCLLDGTCVSFGFRRAGEYCDVDRIFYPQKQSGESCDNNFECVTNTCSKGACIDLERELKETIGFLKRIWCKIIHLFNDEAYASCLIG